MELSKDIAPVTQLKAKSAALIRRARESGQPIIITQNGKATAVLQDVESFDRMRRAFLLLKFLAKGDRELSEGKAIPHRKALHSIQRRLNEVRGK